MRRVEGGGRVESGGWMVGAGRREEGCRVEGGR
jgi:hypothetical protein